MWKSLWNPAWGNVGDDTDATIAIDTQLTFGGGTGHASFQYRNLTINSGVTLTLIQNTGYGAVLYVNGDLTVNGTLLVAHTFSGTSQWDGATDGSTGSGAGGGAAGGATTSTGTVAKALYGDETQAESDYRRYFRYEQWQCPGVGGRGYDGAAGTVGGKAGGNLIVIVKGKITIASTGTISAAGGNGGTSAIGFPSGGGGGGAGGMIILVSYQEISGAAGSTLTASGGNGGNGNPNGIFSVVGGGGGGGGGAIILIAPSITTSTVTVANGTGGTSFTSRAGPIYGGGGGGGSFGAGGAGSGTAAAGSNGSVGDTASQTDSSHLGIRM